MSKKNGFLVAADSKQEWLLPWWWKHYSSYNCLPVTFVDIGMTPAMESWCKDRGNYIRLPSEKAPVITNSVVAEDNIPYWEKKYGKDLWEHRPAWFKKPQACLLSPYEKTVWMDLDCEVKGCLDEIFSIPTPPFGVSCCSEYLQGNWIGVNSGVVVFLQDSYLVQEWADESFLNHHLYAGDQDVLSALIAKNPLTLGDLPICYNHSRFNHNHSEALVIHWHGDLGKKIIASSMNQ